MPMLQMYLNKLNQKFSPDELKRTVRQAGAVAPGRRIDADFVIRKNSLAYKTVQNYLNSMPDAVAETLRAAMYHSLTSNPPKSTIFSWTPAYEFDITVTELGCGLMVRIGGRYPADEPPPRGRD